MSVHNIVSTNSSLLPFCVFVVVHGGRSLSLARDSELLAGAESRSTGARLYLILLRPREMKTKLFHFALLNERAADSGGGVCM
jgi:hypothetical protein